MSEKHAPWRRVAGGLRANANALLWTAAAVSIATGYALLARGGTTLPAFLLVLGYAALVPVAIAAPRIAVDVRRVNGNASRRGEEPAADHPPYARAALVSVCVLVLYCLTLAPTTAMWDTSEYMAAAKVLGIPHPPGNPLFILIAYLFGTLPIAREYAVRINLLAATASAAAAGIWFLLAHEATRGMFAARGARLAAAAACAVLGATSFTVWNQSVVNEKVYTVSLLQLAVVIWLAVRWTRLPPGARADRLLIAIAYLLALGYTIHPAGYLGAPAVLAIVLLRAPRTLLRWKIVAAGAGATLLGLSLFAFEPVRSANHPAINEGEPTACTHGFAIACTFSRDTLARLRAQIARDQYGKPDLSVRQAPFGTQLGMWWIYFRWQWFRDAHGAHPAAQIALALLAIALALTGARTQARVDRDGFVVTAAMLFTLTVALVYYLNFKYGYSQPGPEGAPREVRDRDYFFLWSFSSLGIWIGLGVATCWQWAAAHMKPGAAAAPGRSAGLLLRTSPVLLVALIPLALNIHAAPRSGQTFTRDWAFDLLDSTAPNAILFTNGDNDTFPLWYAQEVEHHRTDVTVVIATYLQTDWFPKQLMRRGLALASSPDEADSVPEVMRVDAPQLFEAGGIRATIPAGYITRDQLFVLRIVRDLFPARPIYFTNSVYPHTLGLDPYLVSEGLAVRLAPAAVAEGNGIVRTRTGMVDTAHALLLWRGTYRGMASFERQGDWIDPASLNMPAQYVFAGALLSEALNRSAATAEAGAVDMDLRKMLAIGGLDRLLTGQSQ